MKCNFSKNDKCSLTLGNQIFKCSGVDHDALNCGDYDRMSEKIENQPEKHRKRTRAIPSRKRK